MTATKPTGQRAAARKTAATQRTLAARKPRPAITSPDEAGEDAPVAATPEQLEAARILAEATIAAAEAAEAERLAAESQPPAPSAAPLDAPGEAPARPQPAAAPEPPSTAPSAAYAERDGATFRLIDAATRRTPVRDEVFTSVTGVGSNVRCNIRLLQEVTIGRGGFLTEQLVCFQGQVLTGAEADRILSILDMQVALEAAAAGDTGADE